MAGIYIHIPFCKQACHYCDFHFSTSLKKKSEMILALADEIRMRKNEFQGEIIETIYFGGGTPSVLDTQEIEFLIHAVYNNYEVGLNPEITLEANPDDLTTEKIGQLSKSRINRLSIGIQSFFDDDLQLMNRAHNASESRNALAEVVKHFDNISIDLIYGIPGMTDEKWKENLQIALSYKIPHISSYALTVEPRTALYKFIQAGKIKSPKEEVAESHFIIMSEMLTQHDFIHYELSNFGKQGYFSKNNSAYWLGKKYIGIGPSAHSFDGKTRSWNISNNSLYIRGIQENKLPSESEILSVANQYNEYVMTGLRTIWGVSLQKIESDFGIVYLNYLLQNAEKFLKNGLLISDNEVIKTTGKGKFLTDGIASDLFYI